jgi:hypothetical protein
MLARLAHLDLKPHRVAAFKEAKRLSCKYLMVTWSLSVNIF